MAPRPENSTAFMKASLSCHADWWNSSSAPSLWSEIECKSYSSLEESPVARAFWQAPETVTGPEYRFTSSIFTPSAIVLCLESNSAPWDFWDLVSVTDSETDYFEVGP